MEEMEQPEKKVIIRGKGIHNKWRWSTIIVSILSVIIISVLSYQLYSVSQNTPENNNGTMQGPGGNGAPSGTPPSGEPGQAPSDDSSDSGTSDSTNSDSTL
ncbi:hypothetical protein ACNRUQ_000213 [Listeria innocua]